MDRETAKQLIETPEYRAATWGVMLALVSAMAWMFGMMLTGATQQGLVFLAALGLSLLLVMVSVGLAMYALVNASRNMRPTQIRGWAIAALVLNDVQIIALVLLVVWLLSLAQRT